jgi:hypothetical protein
MQIGFIWFRIVNSWCEYRNDPSRYINIVKIIYWPLKSVEYNCRRNVFAILNGVERTMNNWKPTVCTGAVRRSWWLLRNGLCHGTDRWPIGKLVSFCGTKFHWFRISSRWWHFSELAQRDASNKSVQGASWRFSYKYFFTYATTQFRISAWKPFLPTFSWSF